MDFEFSGKYDWNGNQQMELIQFEEDPCYREFCAVFKETVILQIQKGL